MQSVLATVNKLRSNLEEWSPDTGLFKSGATELVRRIRCGTRAAIVKTTNQRKQSTSSAAGGAYSRADEEDYKVDRDRCVEACTRTIEGGKATLSELAVMLEHMIRALDDSATGESPSMQVTLAMRRLRETVYEIVEGAKQMPGGSQSVDSPTSSPKASAWKPALPARPASRVTAPAAAATNQTTDTNLLSTRSQLAESIAKAEEIATDVGDAAGTQELRGFTSEIENSVQKLVQLQSRASMRGAVLFDLFDTEYEWKLQVRVLTASPRIRSDDQ
ncbi:unnamed protein product [Dibothriocephalus latus]|uniref:Uncharacterized protein n=1 Tax=Dibothriocephalus latus TaxID=60516 RepID=A0A3P7QK30_DIBLA|nr:unnamed protein product [Dibothriocephalus latus]